MELLTQEQHENAEKNKSSSTDSTFQHEPFQEGTSKPNKKIYSFQQLEALRFVDADHQIKKFEEFYSGLEPSVKEDFDSIFEADSGSSNKRNRTKNRNKNRRNKNRNKTTDGQENSDAGVVIGEEIEMNQFGPDQQNHNNSNNYKNKRNDDYDISDDDRYDGILKPAFLVEGEPDFESGPPLDGLEYLRRVRWEANQIPDVNIAKLNLDEICDKQTDYMPKVAELPKCPSNLLPSEDWQDSFVSYFSDLRKSISDLENSMNQDQQQNIFTEEESESESQSESRSLETFPSVQTLLSDSVLFLRSSFQVDGSTVDVSSFQLDTSDIQQTCAGDDSDDKELSCVDDNSKVDVSSLQLDTSSDKDKDKPVPTLQSLLTMESVSRTSTLKTYISKVSSLETLTFHDCLWLFSLCLTIDQPLNADTCAALRSLLRKCLGIVGKREKVDDEVVMVGVLVVVCGRYFGQFDK